MLQRFLSAFRRTRTAPSPDHLRRDIDALEHKVGAAERDARPQIYNRLGDLYMKASDRSRALTCYGLGIDAYLEMGHFDPAAALCRKMIGLVPGVVRARCTLAFLSLGKGLVADAGQEIAEYVRAAQKASKEEMAITRLRLMANATDDHDIRLILGGHLAELGDSRGSNEVFGAVYAERNGLRSPPREDQRERWARLLRVAITGSVELQDEDAAALIG